ncbi:MAG: hypothetical protein ACRERD_08715 [Candidatus Binatia bacterium]
MSASLCALSPQRAFVIQLREESEVGGRFGGRVEHVTSARSARFQSVEELLAFIAQVLGDMKKATE